MTAINTRGMIGYLNPEGQVETVKARDDKKEKKRKTLNKVEKTINDARFVNPRPTLDANGSEMVPFVSALKTYEDFHDKTKVRSVLYPEVCEFLKRYTGASFATIVGSVVRSEDPFQEGKASGLGAYPHAYARNAHTDAQDEKSERFCRKMISQRCQISAEATRPEAMDVAMFNFWKPYERIVAQNPLTVLDCASLKPEDVQKTTFEGARTQGVTQLWDNQNHRWLYWPAMTPDEAVVFKQMDTRPNVAQFGFHQSFEDPAAPQDAPGRRSIECRVVLGFPKPQAKL